MAGIGATRAYHVNVNCSDLQRSYDYYVGELGFEPLVRTTPPPQPGTAFGLDVAQWDAHILAGADGMAGVVLDLLEWKVPAPEGTPVDGNTGGGLRALTIETPTVDTPLTTRDPDGTALFLTPGSGPRITELHVGAVDLDQTVAWYCDVLGGVRMDPDGVRDPGGVLTFRIGVGDPVQPVANGLGLFRCALFTADIDASYRALLEHGTRCFSPPAALDMGPGLPDDLRALFFADPSGACMELIEARP